MVSFKAASVLLLLPLLSCSFSLLPIHRIHQHPLRHDDKSLSRPTTTALGLAKSQAAKARMTASWYPGVSADVQEQCLAAASEILWNGLNNGVVNETTTTTTRAYDLARGRFLDLCTTQKGSHILENLFLNATAVEHLPDPVLRGVIYSIQSLCIMGMLVGIKGSPDQQQRRVQHLHQFEWRDTKANYFAEDHEWTYDDIHRLKYESGQTAGTQLLATMKWKRTTQGALDLLVALKAWTRHEDLGLLRSGFPVTFSSSQLEAAALAESSERDVDEVLGIRRDLTHLKVYTIDSVSTSEVDDGVSVETLADGSYKYWIHIADADRWAPRNSQVFEIAKARTTTHYSPTGAVPMFPASLSTGVMSLRPNTNVCALSLGAELNDDGSINVDSLEVTQSTICVSYRLSYDEVDEMLQEGVGYQEEWELGALVEAATKRRQYRINKGSTEGMIPYPIPRSAVEVRDDKNSPDGVDISISIEASHNSGRNQTFEDSVSGGGMNLDTVNAVSDSNLLVTEMMILGGEAMGQWKLRVDTEPATFCGLFQNTLDLPYRSQPKPDYRSREKEYNILQDLLEHKHGYCHAWYARRFMSPVSISSDAKPHAGLGIDTYVQWTSPIRRFGDLQVHAVVKRYLRRRRMHDLVFSQEAIPAGITEADLGCPVPDGGGGEHVKRVDEDIDYNWGRSLVSASRTVDRQSQQYWLFEFLSRQLESGSPPVFEALVLGCVDPARKQYAVYLPEIGYEHRYLSEKGFLEAGECLKLKIQSVTPRTGLMTLALVNI